MPPASPWTADDVGCRLIAAFRRLPGHPVMSRGRAPGFDERGGGEVEPFGWPQRYLVDMRDRRLVLAWARCHATGDSFAALCRGFGWDRLNTGRLRRAALATIAAGLNRDDRGEAGP